MSERLGEFYVYAVERDGVPVYIGKGTGSRARQSAKQRHGTARILVDGVAGHEASRLESLFVQMYPGLENKMLPFRWSMRKWRRAEAKRDTVSALTVPTVLYDKKFNGWRGVVISRRTWAVCWVGRLFKRARHAALFEARDASKRTATLYAAVGLDAGELGIAK